VLQEGAIEVREKYAQEETVYHVSATGAALGTPA
jgi:hypothetical protein